MRRLLLLLLLLGTVAAAVALRRDRSGARDDLAPPVWPPLPARPPVAPATSALRAEPESPPATWKPLADDGSVPDGYPIKANDSSMIFHVPGGRFYDRTKPERCYATETDATADGYRRAKS